MADIADANRSEANIPETARKGWNPSRGFWIGMGAVALFAATLATVGAIEAGNDTEVPQFQAQDGVFPTVVLSRAPHITTPPDDFTSSIPSAPDTVASSAGASDNAAATTAVVSADDATVSSSAYEAPILAPVASSWSQAPEFEPPAPASSLSPSAMALVTYAADQFGIEIATEGQDWGATDVEQVANIGAVVDAWEKLPASVSAAVGDHAHGSLKILSNQQGRTIGGWQPYGDGATTFYTNSDQGVSGHGASHQIVLATGAGTETVLHEMFHAYEMRNVGADQYVAAMLDEEMLSFMETAGWQLLVSQDDLLANAHETWETIDSLFAYEGSDVSHGSNPLEAFASSAAIFYGDDGSMLDQPEVSDWFTANLG